MQIALLSSYGGEPQLQHQDSAPRGDVQTDVWWLQEERRATRVSRKRCREGSVARLGRALLGGVSHSNRPL